MPKGGPNIQWDETTGKAVLVYAGKRTDLPGTYPTFAKALEAGDALARQQGFQGGPPPPSTR